jgi:hypothetical protein
MHAGNPLSPATAFLKGYKPACLEVPIRESPTDVLHLLLDKYPYVSEKMYDLLGGREFFLFFHVLKQIAGMSVHQQYQANCR